MTHADLTFLLLVAWAGLALWCIPWAAIFTALDRWSQRRVDRMVETALAADVPAPDDRAADIAASVLARVAWERAEDQRWRCLLAAVDADPFLDGPAVQPGDPDDLVVWITGRRPTEGSES